MDTKVIDIGVSTNHLSYSMISISMTNLIYCSCDGECGRLFHPNSSHGQHSSCRGLELKDDQWVVGANPLPNDLVLFLFYYVNIAF